MYITFICTDIHIYEHWCMSTCIYTDVFLYLDQISD